MNQHEPSLTDQKLIDTVQPPYQMAEAFLQSHQSIMRILLDALFSTHELNHFKSGSDDNNVEKWTDVSDTIIFRTMYEEDRVPCTFAEIAPNWDAYVQLAERLHHDFPYSCAEYDDWFWGMTRIQNQGAWSFFARC